MRWKKGGLIFVPKGDVWWARGYTHLPTAQLLGDDVLRVYFASLDEHKFGRIGYVDVAADDPSRLLAVATEPVLDLGEIGTFDDSGVVPSCIVTVRGQTFCYYHGFQRTERVPYLIFAGRATIDPATGRFVRHSRTPILERTEREPFIRGAPAVLYEDGGFKMWYVACVRWVQASTGMHYQNVIRYATSRDGLTWEAHEHVCLEPNLPDEYSVGRPAVLRNAAGYHMWFSARSHSEFYKISYAHSDDGLHWTRDDREASIGKSPEGWDSEIICYANLIRVRDRLYMFYNGNRHGASGFGYAVAE